MASPNTINRLSIQCVENPDGYAGVVVYDEKTYPLSPQQDALELTASGERRASYSSVRVFQFPQYENEENSVDLDPIETDSNSLTSVEEAEEGEEAEWRHIQPSGISFIHPQTHICPDGKFSHNILG